MPLHVKKYQCTCFPLDLVYIAMNVLFYPLSYSHGSPQSHEEVHACCIVSANRPSHAMSQTPTLTWSLYVFRSRLRQQHGIHPSCPSFPLCTRKHENTSQAQYFPGCIYAALCPSNESRQSFKDGSFGTAMPQQICLLWHSWSSVMQSAHPALCCPHRRASILSAANNFSFFFLCRATALFCPSGISSILETQYPLDLKM